MRAQAVLVGAALLLTPVGGSAQVEKVRAGTADTPGLPEDLFDRPPGAWVVAQQLWAGDEPCTADQCEAGYTSGDLVVSIERSKKDIRIVGGFRNCSNVAWNFFEIGEGASKSDTRTVRKRLKRVLAASAKYCKVTAPALPPLDTALLFPPKAAGQ